MPQSQETFCQLLESAGAAAEGGERKSKEQTVQGNGEAKKEQPVQRNRPKKRKEKKQVKQLMKKKKQISPPSFPHFPLIFVMKHK